MIGLSGLITPSLDEMVFVAKEMERRGIAAAAAHRRRDHEPAAHGGEDRAGVPRAGRARARRVARGRRRLEPAEPTARAGVRADEPRAMQDDAARSSTARASEKPLLPYEAAKANRLRIDWDAGGRCRCRRSSAAACVDVPLEELVPYIDWTFFFAAWELKGRFPAILDHPQYGHAARDLYDNARALLDRIVARAAADAQAASTASGRRRRDGDDIVLFADRIARARRSARFPMLRQQEPIADGRPNRSLADFVAPASSSGGATTSALSR